MQESTQSHLITNYLVEKNSNIDPKTQSKIMHILKTEIYPDPFSHITTKILEYPKLLDDKDETTTSTDDTNSNENSTNDTKSDNGSYGGGGGGGGSGKHKTKKIRSRKSLRYMTQPVTLNEIKETDEELFNQTTTENTNINSNTSTKAADISIIVDSISTSKITQTVQNQNDPPPNSPASDLSKSFNSLLLNEAIFLNRRANRKPTKKQTEKQSFKYMD